MGNIEANCCSVSNTKNENAYEDANDIPPSSASNQNNNSLNKHVLSDSKSYFFPKNILLSKEFAYANHHFIRRIQHNIRIYLGRSFIRSIVNKHSSEIPTILSEKYLLVQSIISSYASESYYLDWLKTGKIPKYETTEYYQSKIHIYSRFSVSCPPVQVDDSTVYCGSWNINRRYNGYGVWYVNNGEARYEGLFLNGDWNGYARLFMNDNEYIIGNFVNAKPNGIAEYYKKDNTIFIGNYLNGVQTGKGEEKYSDGSNFIGYYMNGKKVCGMFHWCDGSFYKGDINNDLFHGKGLYTWADSKKQYEGQWKNGKMNGYGKWSYSDGTFYEGEFKDNERSGLGKYYWSKNKYYNGEWKKGKQNGNGIYYKNGKAINAVWANGNIIKEWKEKVQVTKSNECHLGMNYMSNTRNVNSNIWSNEVDNNGNNMNHNSWWSSWTNKTNVRTTKNNNVDESIGMSNWDIISDIGDNRGVNKLK